MKYPIALFLLFFLSASVSAQDTPRAMTPEEQKLFLSNIQVDSATMLANSANEACGCIDSVYQAGGSKQVMMDGVSKCIDAAAIGYQAVIGVMNSMKKGTKAVVVATDEKSKAYQTAYFKLESRLKDSCKSLNLALFTNDDRSSDHSVSDNAAARKAYNEGLPYLRESNYAAAIPWFEKATKLDRGFAFAWDNLGVCYRKTGQNEKAVQAYTASLKADPKGRIPLQNLPVALGMLGKADEAITAYKHLLTVYPDDPEAYYGMGMIYLNNKKDNENALENLCIAYNLYVAAKSPYRSDAETLISSIYQSMKKEGKLEAFSNILKKHNISAQ